MDTSSISSNKITLRISTPQGREMALNKGEVLQAQVQEVGEDGSVTIMVKGKNIEAFTEVPVKPGQQLLLMVDDLKQGKTYLKVVTPELMGKIETANISANLVGMGIAAREENIMLARKLLQHNLPVTQNNLSELSRNVNLLGGMNAKNLEIGAFALSRGIAGQDALLSLARFLSSPGETARLMPALERLVTVLTTANADGQSVNQAAGIDNNASQGKTAAAAAGFTANADMISGNLAASANNSTPTSQTAQSNASGQPVPGNQTPATAVDAAIQTAAAQESSVSSSGNIGTSQAASAAFGSSEARQSIPPGSTSETDPEVQTVQTGAAAGKTAVDEETYPAGSPKQASGMIDDATGDSGRAGGSAGSTSKTAATMANDEVLTGSSSRNDNPSQAQTSAPGAEKPANMNQSEPGLTLKPDNSGTLSKENTAQPSAAAGDKTAPQAAAADKNIPAAGEKAGLAGTDETTPAPAVPQADGQTVSRLLTAEDSVNMKAAQQGIALDNEPLKQDLAKLLDAVRSLMEVNLQDSPEKIAGKLQSGSTIDKDIVKALSLLVDMAKNPGIADKIPELKEFSLSLDRMEKEMSGQQLFNLSSRSATDHLSSYYYFAFPVKIDQEYSLCQLKINKDGRRSLKDVDQLSFVISLNTSKLGQVLFHINWQKSGSLQLQGVAENQASSNFLNQNINELVNKLEKLGYSVKNMGVKVSSSAEELRLRPVLQEVTERVRPLGIDVTV